MNAPLTPHQQAALHAVALQDRYTQTAGRAFMSGVQALVRLPMLQQMRDAQAGHRTAGFISGYRGSPLGTYDQALWDAAEHLARHDIVFQPGVNEELAVDAVWGSQQLEFDPASKRYDGVFGLWYAKGPGVDRSGDALKHANLAGTAALGGVLAVAGDDHVSKSSTLAHQSDHTFMACGLPVFIPGTVQDILDLGLHAYAMSRYAGLWVGMKTVQEVVESASSVALDPLRVSIVLPHGHALPAGGVHIRWPDDPLAQEARLMEAKWPAALAYVRANRLNRNTIEGPCDRLGIIASGKAYGDVCQALADLGLDERRCREIGLRLHKVQVAWPMEPHGVRAFAAGLQEVLVVEEKRPLIELQLKDELYHLPAGRRPRISGKLEAGRDDAGGEWSRAASGQPWLLRATADLDAAIVARAIARRLHAIGVPPDIAARMDARLALLAAGQDRQAASATPAAQRPPWFCPGCPHNTSTRVPEGSTAMAGIGCHGMVTWMDRATTSWTQMGGEGVPWSGQARFSTRTHMFANLGDGTYNHSGLLAIRQSVAAGVNLTYKILFNGAVAMTGGQPVEGGMGLPAMTRELEAEGVRRIVVVSDRPQAWQGDTGFAPGVQVTHRRELDAVQRELREQGGVTAIVYEQECATKKRRERKRGQRAQLPKRVVINELVCEGCGDCSVQSNCVAVHPLETDYGRKRAIHQGSCNQDLSCVEGFCPSFVTVEGGTARSAPSPMPSDVPLQGLPAHPDLPRLQRAWGIVIAGIGGTGVVTIGQVLGMAAHLDGLAVVTQDATGMAQMGGATWSHVQIAPDAGLLHGARVGPANADLVIACDAVVGAHRASLAVLQRGRSFVALNTHATPTSGFVRDANWRAPHADCIAALQALAGDEAVGLLDAQTLAERLLGSAVYANMLLLGYAWQCGKVPLSMAAILRAIELNGVQVEGNERAFSWGRRCAHDLAAVERLAMPVTVVRLVRRPSLEQLLQQRAAFLTDYQDAAYADSYRAFVMSVRAAEAPHGGGTRLAEAVAQNLFKLMAYKDEYEVARLHVDPAFTARIAQEFGQQARLVHHLAPPLLARRNARGEPVKRAFGRWIRPAMHVLARMKVLRGTAFDPFGYTHERRQERALVVRYRACIEELLAGLTPERVALAVEIASVPQEIRGYGHVKARHLKAAQERWDALLQRWRAAPWAERQAA